MSLAYVEEPPMPSLLLSETPEERGTLIVPPRTFNPGRLFRSMDPGPERKFRLTKLVLPSSLPYIFTGMRLSLGTGWMVLIAAEMLAQNPGLGKFVWDEFQNGSADSMSRMLVAVFTIGFIGFIVLNAMFKRGWALSVVERENQVLPRMLDAAGGGPSA